MENSVFGTSTRGRSARIFTAYGERENESHAAIALIAKALLKQILILFGGQDNRQEISLMSQTRLPDFFFLEVTPETWLLMCSI